MFDLPKTIEECQAAEREVLALLEGTTEGQWQAVSPGYIIAKTPKKDNQWICNGGGFYFQPDLELAVQAPALAHSYIALLRSHAELLARDAESDALIEELKERV